MSLQNEYLLLNKDEEGLWSLTQQKDADKISQIIINMVGSDKKIIDGTAGLGGNTISFCKYFKEVVGIEKDTSRYNLLALNLSSYQFNNLKLYNNSCLEFLDNEYDVIFFDPPWGGYQYKKHKELNLFLDNYSLKTIIKMVKKNNRLCVFKLPYNYNMSEFREYNYQIININNYLLILL